MHHELSTDATSTLRKIDIIVNQLDNMFGVGANGVTPFALCLEMVDRAVDFSNFNQRILDPACGKGSFMLAVIKRFIEAGCPVEQAVLNVYGIDNSKSQCRHTSVNIERATGYMPNIECADSLVKEFTMKFDVVVGNPPYQGTNTVSEDRVQPKNHNLWTKFIQKSFNDLVANDGYLAFVTPDSWMSPTNEVFQLFKNNQLHSVDLDCGRYFNVGSSFTAWVAQKTPSVKNTKIGKLFIDIKNTPYLPRDVEKTLSIHQKVLNYNGKKLKVVTDITCHSSRDTVSKTQSDEYRYPMLHTNAQTRWSTHKSKYFDNVKVMWTLSGYYNPQIDLGVKGFTEVNQAIIVDNSDEANAVLSYMNSELYRFIVNTAKWSGFLHGKVFSMLPDLGKNHTYTDNEIYSLFKLTDKEIEIVKSYN